MTFLRLVFFQKLLPIEFILLDKSSLLHGPLDSNFDFIQLKRFADVVIGSLTDGLDGSLNGSKSSDHNHRGIWSILFEKSEQHPFHLYLPSEHR